jgi:hypothetical protein
MSQAYLYAVYNFTLQAPFVFPELWDEPNGSEADVIVRFGDVPEALDEVQSEGVLYQVNDRQLLLKLEGLANYLVQNGNEIIIDPVPGIPISEVRLFLLGSCLGALLQQRNIFPIHASAIQTERGAVLFCGPSGVGKSTLAGAFMQRGYRLQCDDVCGVVFAEDGQPLALPAIPRTKLWADSATTLGYDVEELTPVRNGAPKYSLSLQDRFNLTTIPLHRIFRLTTHNEPGLEIKDLSTFAAVRQLVQNTYRRRFLDTETARLPHFQLATRVAERVPVKVVQRPNESEFSLDALVDLLIENFE